jgi:hypothetical protein
MALASAAGRSHCRSRVSGDAGRVDGVVGHLQVVEADLGDRGAGGDHERAPAGRVEGQPGIALVGDRVGRPGLRGAETGGDPSQGDRPDRALAADHRQPGRADRLVGGEQHHQPAGDVADGAHQAGQLVPGQHLAGHRVEDDDLWDAGLVGGHDRHPPPQPGAGRGAGPDVDLDRPQRPHGPEVDHLDQPVAVAVADHGQGPVGRDAPADHVHLEGNPPPGQGPQGGGVETGQGDGSGVGPDGPDQAGRRPPRRSRAALTLEVRRPTPDGSGPVPFRPGAARRR